MDLHAQIMNLPAKDGASADYKEGHRDARHAAASLASEASAQDDAGWNYDMSQAPDDGSPFFATIGKHVHIVCWSAKGQTWRITNFVGDMGVTPHAWKPMFEPAPEPGW